MQKSLYQDQKNKTNDKNLLEIAKDLESKLSLKENEVEKLKEIELELKKQLYMLKKNKYSYDCNQLNNRFSTSTSKTENKLSRLCSISQASPIKINEKQLEIIPENKNLVNVKQNINRSATISDKNCFFPSPEKKNNRKSLLSNEIKEFDHKFFEVFYFIEIIAQ